MKLVLLCLALLPPFKSINEDLPFNIFQASFNLHHIDASNEVLIKSGNNSIQAYSLDQGKISFSYLIPTPSVVNILDLTNDGSFLLTVENTNKVKIYGQNEQNQRLSIYQEIAINNDDTDISAAAIEDNHSWLIIGKESGFIFIFKFNQERKIFQKFSSLFFGHPIKSISTKRKQILIITTKQVFIMKNNGEMVKYEEVWLLNESLKEPLDKCGIVYQLWNKQSKQKQEIKKEERRILSQTNQKLIMKYGKNGFQISSTVPSFLDNKVRKIIYYQDYNIIYIYPLNCERGDCSIFPHQSAKKDSAKCMACKLAKNNSICGPIDCKTLPQCFPNKNKEIVATSSSCLTPGCLNCSDSSECLRCDKNYSLKEGNCIYEKKNSNRLLIKSIQCTIPHCLKVNDQCRCTECSFPFSYQQSQEIEQCSLNTFIIVFSCLIVLILLMIIICAIKTMRKYKRSKYVDDTEEVRTEKSQKISTKNPSIVKIDAVGVDQLPPPFQILYLHEQK